MKILIATPAYDGKVNIAYAISMAETCTMLTSKGIHLDLFIPHSGSLLCAERNRILKKFLETDATHLLCIDSDLGWPSKAVEAFIAHEVDFVAGVYPARGMKTFMFRPKLNPDQSLVTNGINLIKMDYIPAGFMFIRREVIEKMIECNPERYFKPKDPSAPDGHALFNTEVYEGEFWGEDFVFCRLVREAGFDIWVDPNVQFNHDGNIGMLAEVLTNQMQKVEDAK